MFISSLMVVVFPAPLGPIIAVDAASGTSRSNALTASVRRKAFDKLSVEMGYSLVLRPLWRLAPVPFRPGSASAA